MRLNPRYRFVFHRNTQSDPENAVPGPGDLELNDAPSGAPGNARAVTMQEPMLARFAEPWCVRFFHPGPQTGAFANRQSIAFEGLVSTLPLNSRLHR